MPTTNTQTAPAPQPTAAKQAPGYPDFAAAIAALHHQSDADFVSLLTDIHADLHNIRH